jgi:formylmethanofuran dehydrogenase subunit E
MTEEQRISQARKAIISIFHAYEEETGFIISDEKYDHVRWLAWMAGKSIEEVEEEAPGEREGYELINCVECGEDKYVEEGTWALDKGMCEPCYCAYEGG